MDKHLINSIHQEGCFNFSKVICDSSSKTLASYPGCILTSGFLNQYTKITSTHLIILVYHHYHLHLLFEYQDLVLLANYLNYKC